MPPAKQSPESDRWWWLGWCIGTIVLAIWRITRFLIIVAAVVIAAIVGILFYSITHNGRD